MKLTLPAAKDWRDNRGWIPGVHRGQDFGWGAGDRVYAAAPGQVIAIYGGGGWNGGWGNQIIIHHGGDVYTTYNHLATGTINVRTGQTVSRGQDLAQMGSTGDSDFKHLHFELRLGGAGSGHRVDPAPYYDQDLPGTGADPIAPASGEKEGTTMMLAMRYTEGGEDKVIVGDTISGFDFSYETKETKANNQALEMFSLQSLHSVDKSVALRFKAALAVLRQGK